MPVSTSLARATFALLVAASAAAPSAVAGPQSFVERVDGNKDGAIQRSEANLWLERLFDRIDSDGDGQVRREEATRASLRRQKAAN